MNVTNLIILDMTFVKKVVAKLSKKQNKTQYQSVAFCACRLFWSDKWNEIDEDAEILGKLIKAIRNADPTKNKYIIVSVQFYDGTKNVSL